MGIEKRRFIRHPSDIPVSVTPVGEEDGPRRPLSDVSTGGMACHSPTRAAPGNLVTVHFPLLDDDARVFGRVVWCRETGDGYRLGIEFLGADDAFRARMCEQVCHIEHYRREARREQGRELTSEEAAAEWIARYAGEFPL